MSEIRFWRAVSSILILGLVLFFFFKVWPVLIPFIMGLAIAYLVNPLVDRFVSMGLRQDRVVLVLYVGLLGVGGLLVVFLLPVLSHGAERILQDIPTYAGMVNMVIDEVNLMVQHLMHHFVGNKAASISITFRADRFIETAMLSLPANLLNYAHWGLWAIIIPFVCFFALSDGRRWITIIFQWTPSEYVESLLGVLAEINATLGGYLRGQMLDSLCVAFVTSAGLYLLGIEGAVFLGCLTGLFNLVPFMSFILGGGLALFAGVFQHQSVPVLVGVFILYSSVRVFDDFVFIPFVVGSNVKLHPVIMLFAILAGFEVAGFIGLIFAVPITAIIKVIATVLLRNRRDGLLPHLHQVYS